MRLGENKADSEMLGLYHPNERKDKGDAPNSKALAENGAGGIGGVLFL